MSTGSVNRNLVRRLFCGLLCSIPLLAHAQWKGEAAAGIAQALTVNVGELIAAAESGVAPADAVQSKNVQAAIVDLKTMRDELERLDLALAAGRNKVQTFAIYQNISNLRASVRDYAEDVAVSEPLREKADETRRLLRELDLQYIE